MSVIPVLIFHTSLSSHFLSDPYPLSDVCVSTICETGFVVALSFRFSSDCNLCWTQTEHSLGNHSWKQDFPFSFVMIPSASHFMLLSSNRKKKPPVSLFVANDIEVTNIPSLLTTERGFPPLLIIPFLTTDLAYSFTCSTSTRETEFFHSSFVSCLVFKIILVLPLVLMTSMPRGILFFSQPSWDFFSQFTCPPICCCDTQIISGLMVMMQVSACLTSWLLFSTEPLITTGFLLFLPWSPRCRASHGCPSPKRKQQPSPSSEPPNTESRRPR